MNARFRYTYRLYPTFILLSLAAPFVALFLAQQRVSALFIVGGIFAGGQALVVIYYLTKRLTLDEEGVTVSVFWKFRVNGVAWDRIEEASLTARRLMGVSAAHSLEIVSLPGGRAVEPVRPKRTAARHLIRIRIVDAEPMYVDLRALESAGSLPDLIGQKVPFIK
jgi:hypothetical protein